MIDAREIIEATAESGASYVNFGRQTASRRRLHDTARDALRLLENCPDEATVMELRDAIQSAYPHVLSGGGGA